MDASDSVKVTIDGAPATFPTVPLPDLFLRWQSEARMRMFQVLREHGAAAIKMQPAHLPVLATWTRKGGSATHFHVNLTTRGMGVVPRRDKLAHYTQVLEQARQETANDPVEKSLPKRGMAMGAFYTHVEDFDPRVLGGLEIFEGQTAKNLEENPCAALVYTGEAPKYPSYQFNGVVTRVEPGDSYYQFLLAARELFATDAFHIHQIRYPFGHLFHVVEVNDKTPYPKR